MLVEPLESRQLLSASYDLRGTLLPNQPQASQNFGLQMAASGNLLLVGNPNQGGTDINGQGASDVGEVSLVDSNTHEVLHTFANPDPHAEDFFGAAVTFVNGKIAISTLAEGGEGGKVYVYTPTIVNGETVYSTPLEIDDPTQQGTIGNPGGQTPSPSLFGSHLAAYGDNVLVQLAQDPTTDSQHSGSVYLFDASSGSVIQKFEAPAGDQGAGDAFGRSMAVQGNQILIGANGVASGPTHLNVGAAYLFDGASGNLLHRFAEPDASAGDQHLFGTAVAFDGSSPIISAPGDDGAGRAGSVL